MSAITENDVTFSIGIEPEDTPVRGSFATGDEEQDRALGAEILARLAQGDTWAWCNVTVTATWEAPDGTVYEGRDQLGACSYANEKDFIECGDYYPEMQELAFKALCEQIRGLAWIGTAKVEAYTKVEHLSPEEKLAIIRAVYETLFTNTSTFHGTCGSDGLYLVGAIVRGETIQVAKNASICVALRGVEGIPGLPPDHPVWTYIEEAASLEEDATCPK